MQSAVYCFGCEGKGEGRWGEGLNRGFMTFKSKPKS